MSHEEAYSELAAVALDAVTAEIAAAVRAHTATCPTCGPELAAMEETAGTLAQLVPPAQINRGRSAGIRSRLVMGARAERESRSAPVPGPPDIARGVASLTGQGHRVTPSGPRPVVSETRKMTPAQAARVSNDPASREPVPIPRGVNWLAIAATLALVATGAQLFRVTNERNEMRGNMRAQAASSDTTAQGTDSLAALLRQKDSMIAAMTGPDMKVVALASDRTKQPMGRMMWNRASNDWIMVTYNMQQPKPGKTYQVWLVTDKQKISAGTFRPDSSGNNMMHAHYVMAPNALRAVAITEEPEGGMPSPTGPMVVAGGA